MVPVRSRRSRDLEKRLYSMDISDISETDVMCTAAYLFMVSKNRENFLDGHICCFLERLVDRLGLRDRLNLVMEKYVHLLEERQVLKLYVPESNNTQVAETDAFGLPIRRGFRENSAADYKYEIDRSIEKYCGQNLDENHKNYYRIMYSEEKGMLSQIIYHTFFHNNLITLEFFHDELPANIKRIVSDTSSMNFLKKELGLSENETRYLLFRYRKLVVSQFAEVLEFFSTNSAYLYTTVLGITKKEFNQITRSDSKLRQFGFIDDNRDLNPEVADVIENKDLSIYFSDCIKKQDLENVHPLNTFSVPEKNTLIYKDLLKSKEPVSLLLYGAPGSGKTEYAKSLANLPKNPSQAELSGEHPFFLT